eukprot:TRINITY_DN10075_c0_g1_i1.p2 TRINITY_DN10075_c0_g1~~TRINITY_DN10075_c0_g1_i1.p2  ORF type:complete len:147 (-),score=23.41 TRINITY_DN10075_c0_g1_i1:44-484(-)
MRWTHGQIRSIGYWTDFFPDLMGHAPVAYGKDMYVYGGIYKRNTSAQYSDVLYRLTTEVPTETSPSRSPPLIEKKGAKVLYGNQSVSAGMWIEVIHPFISEGPEEVSVKKGDIALVVRTIGPWLLGYFDDGRSGWIPKNYCQQVVK